MKATPMPNFRDATLAQTRLDAERWVDEGGSFSAEAPSALTEDKPKNVTAVRPAGRYRCPCEHVFQVFGTGRHRRYYELADVAWEHPVMGRVCPTCQRGLAGKT